MKRPDCIAIRVVSMAGFRTAVLVAIVAAIVLPAVALLTVGTENASLPIALAYSLAAICVYCFAVVCFFLAISRSFRRPDSRTRWAHFRASTIDWALWLLLATILVLLLPALPDKEAALQMVCSENLKQLGLAMREYSAKYDCYPPAYAVDHQGRPTVSWRVLLLPYIEGGAEVYKNIRLDERVGQPAKSSGDGQRVGTEALSLSHGD